MNSGLRPPDVLTQVKPYALCSVKTAEVTNTLDAKYFEILEYDLFLPLPVYLNEQVLSEFRVAEAKSHIVHE